MKLTSSQLRKIIREELNRALTEIFDEDDEYAAEEAAEAAEEERYFKEKLPSMKIEDKWMDMNSSLVGLTPHGMRPSAFLEELFLGGQLAKKDEEEVIALLKYYDITREELPALIKYGASLSFTPGTAAKD